MKDSQIKVNVATETEKFLKDFQLLVAGMSAHLRGLPGLEFAAMERFTVVGLVMAVSAEIQRTSRLLEDWGFLEKRQ